MIETARCAASRLRMQLTQRLAATGFAMNAGGRTRCPNAWEVSLNFQPTRSQSICDLLLKLEKERNAYRRASFFLMDLMKRKGWCETCRVDHEHATMTAEALLKSAGIMPKGGQDVRSEHCRFDEPR